MHGTEQELGLSKKRFDGTFFDDDDRERSDTEVYNKATEDAGSCIDLGQTQFGSRSSFGDADDDDDDGEDSETSSVASTTAQELSHITESISSESTSNQHKNSLISASASSCSSLEMRLKQFESSNTSHSSSHIKRGSSHGKQRSCSSKKRKKRLSLKSLQQQSIVIISTPPPVLDRGDNVASTVSTNVSILSGVHPGSDTEFSGSNSDYTFNKKKYWTTSSVASETASSAGAASITGECASSSNGTDIDTEDDCDMVSIKSVATAGSRAPSVLDYPEEAKDGSDSRASSFFEEIDDPILHSNNAKIDELLRMRSFDGSNSFDNNETYHHFKGQHAHQKREKIGLLNQHHRHNIHSKRLQREKEERETFQRKLKYIIMETAKSGSFEDLPWIRSDGRSGAEDFGSDKSTDQGSSSKETKSNTGIDCDRSACSSASDRSRDIQLNTLCKNTHSNDNLKTLDNVHQEANDAVARASTLRSTKKRHRYEMCTTKCENNDVLPPLPLPLFTTDDSTPLVEPFLTSSSATEVHNQQNVAHSFSQTILRQCGSSQQLSSSNDGKTQKTLSCWLSQQSPPPQLIGIHSKSTTAGSTITAFNSSITAKAQFSNQMVQPIPLNTRDIATICQISYQKQQQQYSSSSSNSKRNIVRKGQHSMSMATTRMNPLTSISSSSSSPMPSSQTSHSFSTSSLSYYSPSNSTKQRNFNGKKKFRRNAAVSNARKTGITYTSLKTYSRKNNLDSSAQHEKYGVDSMIDESPSLSKLTTRYKNTVYSHPEEDALKSISVSKIYNLALPRAESSVYSDTAGSVTSKVAVSSFDSSRMSSSTSNKKFKIVGNNNRKHHYVGPIRSLRQAIRIALAQNLDAFYDWIGYTPSQTEIKAYRQRNPSQHDSLLHIKHKRRNSSRPNYGGSGSDMMRMKPSSRCHGHSKSKKKQNVCVMNGMEGDSKKVVLPPTAESLVALNNNTSPLSPNFSTGMDLSDSMVDRRMMRVKQSLLNTNSTVSEWAFIERRRFLVSLLDRHCAGVGPPFTLQRLAEVLENPHRFYTQTQKLCNGLEKLMMVKSTSASFGGSSGGEMTQRWKENRERTALAKEREREYQLRLKRKVVADNHKAFHELNLNTPSPKFHTRSRPFTAIDNETAASKSDANVSNNRAYLVSRDGLAHGARTSLCNRFIPLAESNADIIGRPASPPLCATPSSPHPISGQAFVVSSPLSPGSHLSAASFPFTALGEEKFSQQQLALGNTVPAGNRTSRVAVPAEIHHDEQPLSWTSHEQPIDRVPSPILCADRSVLISAREPILFNSDQIDRQEFSSSEMEFDNDVTYLDVEPSRSSRSSDPSSEDDDSDRSDRSDRSDGSDASTYNESFTAARVMALNRMQQQQRREQFLQMRALAAIKAARSQTFHPPPDSEYQSGDSIDSMMAEDSCGSDSSSSDVAD